MVSHVVWKTWPSGLSCDKNLGLPPRFLSTESLGPCFSHGMGDHDQILQHAIHQSVGFVLTIGTSWLALMDKLRGVCCEFRGWTMFYLWDCSGVCNIAITMLNYRIYVTYRQTKHTIKSDTYFFHLLLSSYMICLPYRAPRLAILSAFMIKVHNLSLRNCSKV